MKGFNKFLAIIFSIIIVLICIILLLYIGGVIESKNIIDTLNILLVSRNTKLISIVTLAIIGLLAVVFAVTMEGDDSTSGGSLTLPLKSGNVSISAQTFETIVLNVAKKYNSIRNAKVKVDIREDGLYVDLFVYVLEGTVVSEIMTKVQEDIKTTMVKQTTVEVKSIAVKIKGIYNKNENRLQD